VEAMTEIRKEMDRKPEIIKNAPHTLPIRRPDEVMAARTPVLTYRDWLRENVQQAPAESNEHVAVHRISER